MLRIVQVSNSLPASFICDPSVEFMPGMVAQLTVIGNQVMATLSNGLAPIGIIDDIRTKSFTNVSWNESIIIPVNGVPGPNNTIVTPYEIKAELKHPHILPGSFSTTLNVVLNPVNGVITLIEGTQLNFDLTGSGTPDAIRLFVNYSYYVPNIPGDDSTAGSNRMTVWFDRMFFQTNQYETNQQYPVNASLYVSESGMLTTRKPGEMFPSVARVTSPPSPLNPMLEAMWF